MNKRGYYDFEPEFEEKLIEGGLVDDVFYIRDLQQRKLFINSDIDEISVSETVKHIMQFNREDNLNSVNPMKRT